MPDPQVLYIVTAVVVLGLVAWVIVVLARPEKKDEAHEARALPAEPVANAPKAADAPKIEVKVNLPDRQKPWLQSHAEIYDEPASAEGPRSSLPGETEEDDGPTGPNALILVTAVGRTDPGLKRKHNEDAYAILEDHQLFVIADGMGRHAAGEVASQLCVEAIGEAFRSGNFGPPRDPPLPRRAARLRGATLLANERILAAATENETYSGMGTTVVSAYFSANNQRVYIAHVGDSRCYRLRGEKLTQLTRDHTLGAAGIEGKTAAILSRAIGVEPSVEVDVQVESPLPGDVYLLCSDGLSRMVAADEIEATLLSARDLDVATSTLTDLANRGGGRDNITVILVRVDDAKPAGA
ncbi:MAG TPA: PP2C family serine/threonine-protein phosphatase [Polyangiaceae bacterium]|jgi:serine/threonine protein phosphatase PrpC|nr:PP2C family serine/threonine-protein phosphatase [Polyangiaceae bacterium]